MNQQLTVTKRDGRKESIDLEKIHRVITWAAEGLRQRFCISSRTYALTFNSTKASLQLISMKRSSSQQRI